MRLVQPVQKCLELRLGLTRIPDDKGRPQGDVGAHRTPGRDLIQRFRAGSRARHAFEHIGMRMLEGDVEIRQQPVVRIGHHRDKLAHMRIGIDVMQPYPSAEFAHLGGQIGDVAAHLAVFPRMHVVFAVQPVGTCVLTNHQKLFDAALHQL